jgi:hypothetical protein
MVSRVQRGVPDPALCQLYQEDYMECLHRRKMVCVWQCGWREGGRAPCVRLAQPVGALHTSAVVYVEGHACAFIVCVCVLEQKQRVGVLLKALEDKEAGKPVGGDGGHGHGHH